MTHSYRGWLELHFMTRTPTFTALQVEKTKEEKNKKQIKRNKRSPGLFSWIYGGREEDDE